MTERRVTQAILLALALIPFGIGCRSFSPESFEMRSRESTRLPRLDVEVRHAAGLMDEAIPGLAEIVKSRVAEEVRSKLTSTSGATYGTLEVVVDAYYPLGGYRGLLWVIPSALTLLTINLFGIPVAQYELGVIADLRVLDAAGRHVARYNERATGSSWVAMYWGYSRNSALAASRLTAAMDALSRIGDRLAEDAPEIRARLIEAGPMAEPSGPRVPLPQAN